MIPGHTEHQTRQMKAIESAYCNGDPSPVSRQDIEALIDAPVDHQHAQGGWREPREAVYSRFMQTPVGQKLGHYALRHDTPDAPEPAAPAPAKKDLSDVYYDGAVAGIGAQIAKKAGCSREAAEAAWLNENPALYEQYLKLRAVEDGDVAKFARPATDAEAAASVEAIEKLASPMTPQPNVTIRLKK